jgi:hypothetical protein
MQPHQASHPPPTDRRYPVMVHFHHYRGGATVSLEMLSEPGEDPEDLWQVARGVLRDDAKIDVSDEWNWTGFVSRLDGRGREHTYGGPYPDGSTD